MYGKPVFTCKYNVFREEKKIYCYFQMADGLDNKKKIKVQKHQKSYQTKVS